jgi:hypothetical protein
MADAGLTYAEKKAKALAAKNTTVITFDELERIKGMCSQTNEKQDYMTMRKNEREEKRTMSLARVSKWPNTIQAERERKEYERIKKLEDDEVSNPVLIHLIFSVTTDKAQRNRRRRRSVSAKSSSSSAEQSEQAIP